MSGTPIKRARREAAAKLAIERKAQAQEAERANEQREPVDYSPELGDTIAELIAGGVPMDDLVIGGAVEQQGISTQVGASSSDIYKWQRKYPEFADAIKDARIESSHRITDKVLALSDVALADPARANSARVAQQILESAASIRNPNVYGDKPVQDGPSYADDIRALQAVQAEREEALLRGDPSAAFPIRVKRALERWEKSEASDDISFDAFMERLKQLDAVNTALQTAGVE